MEIGPPSGWPTKEGEPRFTRRSEVRMATLREIKEERGGEGEGDGAWLTYSRKLFQVGQAGVAMVRFAGAPRPTRLRSACRGAHRALRLAH